MNNKTQKKIAPLFSNNIINQITGEQNTTTNKLTNTLKTLNPNKGLNSKPISQKKLLGLYLKGINLYDKNLSSFIFKWNNKKLISSIKKNSNSNLVSSTSPLNVKQILDQPAEHSIGLRSIPTFTEDIGGKDYGRSSLNTPSSPIIPKIPMIPNFSSLNPLIKENPLGNFVSNKPESLKLTANLINKYIQELKEKANIIERKKIEQMMKETSNKNNNNNNNNFKLNRNTIPVPIPIIGSDSDSSLISTTAAGLLKANKRDLSINKYLKNISIFNSYPKGKVKTYSEIITYNFNTVNNKLIKNIYTLLAYSFFSMSCLISKPFFEITPEKVVIHLYFFLFKENKKRNLKENSSNTFLSLNSSKLNKILKIFNLFFKKPVELELVRLHYPYFNSNILVNLFGLIINKIKVRFLMKKLFKKAIIKNPTKLPRKSRITFIPSFLSGLKIRIAGRLMTHRVVPRKTVKTIRRGALARGKVNFLDIARFTNKNKRGAFSITISAGQNIT